MAKRIYIRHAMKEYANGEQGCDPPITEEGKEETIKIADKLYSAFGLPTVIITSPFLRTRQTALIIKNRLTKLSSQDIPLICDKKIGEYLGNQPLEIQAMLTKETLSYDPFIGENISSLLVRIREHNDTLAALEKDDFTFFIISHGLIIKKLARFNGFFLPGYPSCLAGLIINGSKVETFGNWGKE